MAWGWPTPPRRWDRFNVSVLDALCQVSVEEEDWVYPGLSFIAEFGGALGMFLGFSFYMFWDLGEFAVKRWSIFTNKNAGGSNPIIENLFVIIIGDNSL